MDECSAAPDRRDYAALAAALAEDPVIATAWVELQRELDRLDTEQSASGDVRAIVARLALDGLWLSNLVDPDRFTPEQLDRILATVWPDERETPAAAEASVAEGMPVGVAYGIWAASGVAVVALLGRVIFGDALTAPMLAGIALIAAGVLLVEFGRTH